MLLALSACRRGGGGGKEEDETGKIVLNYWSSITGPDSVQMRKLVDAFNKEYEGKIEVVPTFTMENEYYLNLETLIPLGKGPDVALLHSYRVLSYANAKLIVPIEDYIDASDVELKTDDYVEDVINSLYFEDKLYGIPLDLHVTGIYYNKTLLEKYDLDVPKNREQLISAAKTVQEGERNAGSSSFFAMPISTVWPSEWIFTTALYQNNGKEITDNSYPGFNTPEGKAAMKVVTDLIHVHKLSPQNVGLDQDLFRFQQGQSLFHINGSWMLNDIIASEVDFGVIPLSNMLSDADGDYAKHIHARSHTFVTPRQTRQVSDKKKEAVITFIKFMGDNSYIWAEAGQIPASNIARESDQYKALKYHPGFGDVENFRVAAASPYYHEAYSPIYSRVTSALSKADYDINKLFNEAEDEGKKLVDAARN